METSAAPLTNFIYFTDPQSHVLFFEFQYSVVDQHSNQHIMVEWPSDVQYPHLTVTRRCRRRRGRRFERKSRRRCSTLTISPHNAAPDF